MVLDIEARFSCMLSVSSELHPGNACSFKQSKSETIENILKKKKKKISSVVPDMCMHTFCQAGAGDRTDRWRM